MKMTRTASFGYGIKYDFTKDKKNKVNPGPSAYEIKGKIKERNDKKRGFIFGLSRE